MRLLWLVFAVTFARAGQAPAQGLSARAEIAVKEVVLSDGTRRYTIPVRVGSVALEAGLDTGSTGLRVLPGVLGEADASASGRDSTYAYGSGARLDGVVGEAVVAVGALSGPTPVQLIRSIGCVDNKPHCPAARVPLKAYGIQGDGLPGEGFKAIIGVNMAEAEIPNPLARIGAKRWILELPPPGDPGPGRLILNPTAEETAGYTLFHIDRTFDRQKGGLHDALQGCLIDRRTKQSVCGAMLMDSGAPGLRVVTPNRMQPWPNDTPAAIVFAEGGHAKLSADFVVGRRAQASHFMTEARSDVPGPRLFVGLLPYFAFSVLYDPGRGVIGLKPREGDLAAR